jgi:hypothetical protein
MIMSRFGAVKVGYGFEALKNNGKRYVGEIVKVAAYDRGTLVTIKYFESDFYIDHMGNQVDGYSPVHKSIYLEDCSEWYTQEPAPINGG